MVKQLELHQRKGKDKELREKASLISSAPEEKIRLFHATDDIGRQNELGNELMEWADREDSFLLDTFPLNKRIAPQWFYRMAKNNSYFDQCLAYAKARLGERIELKLKDNPIYQQKALPLYSTLWIEAEEKKLKENAIIMTEIKTVGIPMIGTKEKE